MESTIPTHMNLRRAFALGPEDSTYLFDLVGNLDGSLLASSASNHAIKLYHPSRLEVSGQLLGHTEKITGLTFAKTNPNILYSSSNDCTVRTWDTRTGTQVAISHCSTGRGVFSAMDINCGDRILAAGTDQDEDMNTKLVFWDTRSNGIIKEFEESHNDDVTHIVFHPNREGVLASGSTDGLVCYFDLEGGAMDEEESLQSVLNSESSVSRIGFFGPEYEFLYCTTHIESLLIWHADSTQKLAHFKDIRMDVQGGGKIDYVIDCQYLPDQQRLLLVAGSFEGDLDLIHVNKDLLTPLYSLKGGHSATVRCFHWNTNTTTLFTGAEDAMLCKWSSVEGVEAGSLPATSAKAASAAKTKAKRATPY